MPVPQKSIYIYYISQKVMSQRFIMDEEKYWYLSFVIFFLLDIILFMLLITRTRRVWQNNNSCASRYHCALRTVCTWWHPWHFESTALSLVQRGLPHRHLYSINYTLSWSPIRWNHFSKLAKCTRCLRRHFRRKHFPTFPTKCHKSHALSQSYDLIYLFHKT